MALNANDLKEKIKSNLINCGFNVIAQNDCLCEAIAKAVVEHIKSNAKVTGTDSQGGSIDGKVE